MKLTTILCFFFAMHLSASVFSQDQKVTLKMKNVTVKKVLQKITNETNVNFFYSNQKINVNRKVDIVVKNKSLDFVLTKLFENNFVSIKYDKDFIILDKKSIPTNSLQDQIKVKGKVVDEHGEPLPGVTIRIKGTSLGTASKIDGTFLLSVPKDKTILIFSFVGMISQEISIKGTGEIKVVLKEDLQKLDDIVVTGLFDRRTESFTGSAKTITGDEIRKISTTNVFSALSILDPAINIRQDNTQGSNPNMLPDIIIRGTSSINASNEIGLNAPLIVIDGITSSIRALYDMDIFDIQSITTLKDASATALYGEQAANGVIVVVRKKDYQEIVRLSYRLTGQFQFPDVSNYDLMNASEKLEFERIYGLYDDATGQKYINEYLPKLKNINSGIDTDWLSKPLRNSFTHKHSLSLSGSGSGMNYSFTTSYGVTHGVMKDDKRENIAVGVTFSHNLNNKLISTIRIDYAKTNVLNSKYGSFASYTELNPYEAPYDENGELLAKLSYDQNNPLYEASLSSFNKSETQDFSANINLRWNIKTGLYVTAIGNLKTSDNGGYIYKSPLSNTFFSTESDKKGSYSISSDKSFNYDGRATVNFNKNIDEKGTMISFNAGFSFSKNKNDPYSFAAIGFLNDNLSDIKFANSFAEGSKPGGMSSENSNVAFISSANLIYLGRYFIDGSLRYSGSSKFGKNQRYAPYWSLGMGWNLHRENWIKNLNIVDRLKLRGSYGHTGSLNFASYQAITTYQYDPNLSGKAGLGANPMSMGNTDLKAQITKDLNIGITSTFLDNRLDFNLDYYVKRTKDMIVPVSMPLSSGISQVSRNIGEQLNRGYEINLSGVILKKDDMYWRIGINASHNYNELVKIGDVLKRQNKVNASVSGYEPSKLYIEGESTSALYAVRSAGIDPADGQEIFITKEGLYTKTYNSQDKVKLGDTEPKLRGSISSAFQYKGFSVNLSLQYSLKGYIYNSTRQRRIESVDAKYNADKRAYTQRWKKPGDVVEYLSIKSLGTSSEIYHSSRFVEKENYFKIPSISLGYEFPREIIKKYGFNSLNFNLSINEIGYFSTVKRERGTSYPFARNVSFTISTRF